RTGRPAMVVPTMPQGKDSTRGSGQAWTIQAETKTTAREIVQGAKIIICTHPYDPSSPLAASEGLEPERICKAMGFLAPHECRFMPCIWAPVWAMWDCGHMYWSRASQRLRRQSSASFGPRHCGLHIRWALP